MNFQLRDREKRSKASIAVSIAVHAVLLTSLAAITFHYPIIAFFAPPRPAKVAPLRYIRLTPATAAAPSGSGVVSRSPTRTVGRPFQLPIVSSIPVGIPAPAAPTSPVGVAVGAGGASLSDPLGGMTAGLLPGIPDSRLATSPSSVPRMPETEGQKAERALSAIYDQYLDSARAAMANKGRDAGDWSWGGKDGDKWGWDKDGIHVGGITIPNVVLAALPLNMSPGGSNMNALTDNRNMAAMRSDIAYHSGMMTEDEFKTAVRRIRERVDRERREKMEKAKPKPKDPPCCSQN